MQKKGASQIDWIISLALFLIYVAWIFIFIRPNMNLGASKESLITILKTNFENENKWELAKYPLFVEYNLTGGRKPLMLDFPSNDTDIYFADGTPFVLWNNKLIFVTNLTTGMNAFWIIQGTNLVSEFFTEGLNTEENMAATENLTVYFDNSMPDTLIYRGTELVKSSSYKINNEPVISPISNFSNDGFAAFFFSQSGNINHTSIIFAYSPEINNFIRLDQNGSYTLLMDSNLYDFSSYYSDNSNYGDFDYGTGPRSINYSYDYITLTGSKGSLSMYFDNDANFNFTFYNSTLRMKISIPIYDDYNYRFEFHEGNHNSTKRIYYTSEIGAVDHISGINLNNISTNYSSLKSRWGFPVDRDFQISIYDNSTAFHYLGPEPLYDIGVFNGNGKNVYAEAQDLAALDDNGNYQAISLLYRIW